MSQERRSSTALGRARGSAVEPGRRVRRARDRRAAFGVLGVVLVGVSLWFFVVRDPGPTYTVHAAFTNAGQLVTGGRVEVAGRPIGSITGIDIDDRGRADIEMRIDDERFVPLRAGTRASIRAVGQATLTNRYVDIVPGPGNTAEIADGGALAPRNLRGIVDLDAVFNAVDAPFRRQLRGLIGRSAQIYSGSGAPAFNAMLRTLDPAAKDVGALLGEIADDERSLRRLVSTGATSAAALAGRDSELRGAVADTATAFRAVADERGALADSLERAPAVLRQAGGTLGRGAVTANRLRPTLRAVPAPQPALRTLLRRVPPTLAATEPAVAKLRGVLPELDTALETLPGLERPLTAALKDGGGGLDEAMPILEGLRFYGSDLILGVVKGLASVAAGGYNETGHYVKLEFVQNAQTALGGTFSNLVPALTPGGVFPGVINVGRDQRNRCPGSNAPPAPDGSNPWFPKAGICDPGLNMSPLVNSPTAYCRTYTRCDGQPAEPKPDVPTPLRAKKDGDD